MAKSKSIWLAAMFLGTLGAGTVVTHSQQCKNFVISTSAYADKTVHIAKMHTVHSKYTLHKWKIWLDDWEKQHPGKVFHPRKKLYSNTKSHVVLTPCLPMVPEEERTTPFLESPELKNTLGITPMDYLVTNVGTPEALSDVATNTGLDTESGSGSLYGGGFGGGGLGTVEPPIALPVSYPNTPAAVTPEPESFTLMLMGAMLITLVVVKKEIQ